MQVMQRHLTKHSMTLTDPQARSNVNHSPALLHIQGPHSLLDTSHVPPLPLVSISDG